MTPHEKAVNAINQRLERLQANLRETKEESVQRFLFQSLVVTIAAAEALNGYIKSVGAYAQRRHGELKQTNETLAAQHAELLKSGQEWLEKLKANPTDRAVRKEIERAQQDMTAIQKNLRRGANALQRELAPSLAMIDSMAESVRRLAVADDTDALKRLIKTVVEQVRDLYAAQSDPLLKDVVDAEGWRKSVGAEIDQAAGIHDAYARTAHQVVLALELMALVLSGDPRPAAEETVPRANESAAARIKEITARLTAT